MALVGEEDLPCIFTPRMPSDIAMLPNGSKSIYEALSAVIFVLFFQQTFSPRDSAHLLCDIVQLVEAKVIRHLLF